RDLAESLLRDSDSLYRALLQRLSPVPPTARRLEDIYAAMLEASEAEMFPAAQMTAVMSNFLKGIGIHLTRQDGLTLQEQQVHAIPGYA
ncbi:MAG: hypothetical protein KDG51_12515, partial [Calditrichaeota bacterium]|nr:hypothetical protein [Calditrichota bacterium]